MPELIIEDLTGGLCTKAPTAMLPNQVAFASNVEWYRTRCGERRLGHDPITLDGGTLAACDKVVFVHTHYPTSNLADAQLWVLGIDGSTPVLKYKTTTWNTVTMPDALTVDGVSEYQVNAVSFHGKLFIAYNSSVDRLHVFVPGASALRRVGLAQPAAPTAADTAAGTIEEVRYYRVRYTEQVSGVTVRRSEPSTVLTYDPTAASSVTVTKPAAISEGETHWELEASKDNVNFYLLATTAVGTTTYVDTTADGADYTAGTLSEDIGDYTLIPSVRYLSVDEDRLLGAGSFEDEDLNSRVMWTPVGKADGVGNDERLELDTDPFIDLDTYEGGGITGISRNVNGYVYAFKYSHVYQGIRTGVRTRAYIFIPLTKTRGAVPGSIVEGVDNNGHPALFALDRDIGPISIGREGGGVQTCGSDLVEIVRQYSTTFSTSRTTQHAVYFPLKKQIRWYLPTSSAVLVLHTQHMRSTDDGFRGGWALWTMYQAPISVCLFADNIESNTARSLTLVPFLGMNHSSLVWQGEVGGTDNGDGYLANITTRQYVLGKYVNDIKVQEVTFHGLAVTDAQMKANLLGYRADLPVGTVTASLIDWTPISANGEDPAFFYNHGHAARKRDDLDLGSVNKLYIAFADLDTPSLEQWGIDVIIVTYTTGQTRGSKP